MKSWLLKPFFDIFYVLFSLKLFNVFSLAPKNGLVVILLCRTYRDVVDTQVQASML